MNRAEKYAKNKLRTLNSSDRRELGEILCYKWSSLAAANSYLTDSGEIAVAIWETDINTLRHEILGCAV